MAAPESPALNHVALSLGLALGHFALVASRLKLSEPTMRLLMAVGGGLCLGAAFPFPGIAGLAWVAPGVIATSSLGATGGWHRFRLGYFAGMAHYLYSLHWLLYIPYRWLGVPFGPALGWVVLSMFLALFVGGWTWLVTGARDRRLFRPYGGLEPWLSASWARRAAWAFFAAASWVAMEMFVTRIFGGFPWNLLGSSQYQLIPLLQIGEWTGIYGVSFLIVWFSVSLAALLVLARSAPRKRIFWLLDLAVPGLAVAVIFNLGFRHIAAGSVAQPARSISVALVQPSIPQTLIWDAGNDDMRFRQLLEMSEQALTNKVGLLVWPEAAVPKLLRYDEQVFQSVTNMAAAHKVWMIIGADDAEPRVETPQPNDADFFNSSFLISPEGKLAMRYRKRSLVIFGEYIPLIKWLPVFSWFTPIQGGFTAGEEPVTFPLTNLDIQTSVLICFEDIFPQLGRSAAGPGIDFLVNITNDGWFGKSAAPWQHAFSAVLRTVENRVPLIRCTNNGLTSWIDEYGRIRYIQRDNQNSIYGQSIGVLEVTLPARRSAPTFYNRYGDAFGWGCCALVLLAAACWWLRGRSPGAQTLASPGVI